MDLGRAASEVGEVIPRLLDRTQAQAEFIRAVLNRLGCSAVSSNGGEPAGSADDSAADSAESTVEPGGPAADAPGDIAVSSHRGGVAGSGSGRGAEVETGVPVADDLAIPSYESLAAAQVVPRLSSLSEPELRAVRAFEADNRHRRTILNRVDQLLSEPG